MPGFMPDSSCMIPALSPWHEHHPASVDEINRRLDRGEPMAVAAPSLVETYSVLTRLPHHRRLMPDDALALIEASFVGTSRVVALDSAAYVDLLRRAPDGRVAGGRIYDAVIAACARQADVGVLVTFNVAHFRALVDRSIEVRAPAQ
jgi:predicted nucleic acid-binding protein